MLRFAQAALAAEFRLGKRKEKLPNGGGALYSQRCLYHIELSCRILGNVLVLLPCVPSQFYSRSHTES